MNSNDEIYLKDIISVLSEYRDEIKRNIWLAIGIIAVVVAISLGYSVGQHREYSASAKLLPFKGIRQMPGGLGGIAGLAGINLPGQQSNQVIPATLYKDLIETVSFRDSVANIPLYFESISKPVSFYEYMLNYYEPSFNEKVGNFMGSFFKIFSGSGTRSKSASDPLKNTSDDSIIVESQSEGRRYTGRKLGVLSELKDRVGFELEEATGLLLINVSMPDNMASASLVNAIIKQLTSTVTMYELQKLHDQLAYIESQYLETRETFESKQKQLAVFQDSNRGLVSASAKIREQHLQNEYDLAFEIYRNLANQREQTKLKLKEDTPVFTILEESIIPNNPSSPRPLRVFFISLFLGSFLSCAFIIIRFLIKNNS